MFFLRLFPIRVGLVLPLLAALEAYAALTEGLSARDAAVRVGRDLGVPRRRAYEIAITLRKRRP